jgi:hypothetical protein
MKYWTVPRQHHSHGMEQPSDQGECNEEHIAYIDNPKTLSILQKPN